MAYPVDPSRVYVRRGYSASHGGVDLTPNVSGTLLPLYAVGAGVVYGTQLGTLSKAGNNVMIRLDSDGSLWWYGHLSRVDVKKGQRVTDGQQIGVMGTTGNSTGVHLHIERHYPKIDAETDPGPYLAKLLPTTTTATTTSEGLDHDMRFVQVGNGVHFYNGRNWVGIASTADHKLLIRFVGNVNEKFSAAELATVKKYTA